MNIEKIARELADKFGRWSDWDSDIQASGPNGNDPQEEREYWLSLTNHVAIAILEEAAKEIMGNCVCDCDPSEGHECVLEHAAEVIRKLKCS